MAEMDAGLAVKIATGDDEDDPTFQQDWKYTAAIPLARASAVSGTGTVIVPMVPPNTGRWWEVLSLAVTGIDDQTAVANTLVAIYASANPVNAVPSLQDLVRPAYIQGAPQTYPNFFVFGRRQLAVLSPQRLIIVAYGVPANTQVLVTARGWDRDMDELQDYSRVPNDKPVTRAG